MSRMTDNEIALVKIIKYFSELYIEGEPGDPIRDEPPRSMGQACDVANAANEALRKNDVTILTKVDLRPVRPKLVLLPDL